MGKVGIGTEHSTEALTVQGNIQVTKIPFNHHFNIGAILDYNLYKGTFRSPKPLLIAISILVPFLVTTYAREPSGHRYQVCMVNI